MNYQGMLRLMNFITDMEDIYLRMNEESKRKNLESPHIFDSEWARNLEMRMIVTNFILYLKNMSAWWRSKAQKVVATLPSSGAEYMKIFWKKIKFLFSLFKDIEIEIDLLIIVRTDNLGAIFVVQSASSSVCICNKAPFCEREFQRRNRCKWVFQMSWINHSSK